MCASTCRATSGWHRSDGSRSVSDRRTDEQGKEGRNGLLGVVSICCLIAVFLGCAGFGGPPHDESEYPTIQPAIPDLVGTYRPTVETTSLIKNEGHYPDQDISIVLEPDGTLQLRNIPDWWGQNRYGEPGGKFGSWTRKWSLTQRGGWWELDFAHLLGQHPPYRIMMFVGDPDSGREMQFSRVGPVNAEAQHGKD